MNSIVIIGDKNDRQLADTLLKILQKSFSINYIFPGALHTVGKTPKCLNLFEFPEIFEFALQDCILILKKRAIFHPQKMSKNMSPVIISESNLKSISSFTTKMPNIYTCGLSPKECVTISSREEDSMVVSLQRSIVLKNKKICDPFEIPCTRTFGIDDYTIMATILTLILVGELSENKAKISGKICFS